MLANDSLWLKTRPPKCVVELFGGTCRPKVSGEEVEKLSPPKYAVIEALVGAGERGMSKSELEHVKGDALKYLNQIRESNKLWADAIIMAGRAWQRYKLKFTSPSPPKRFTVTLPPIKIGPPASK